MAEKNMDALYRDLKPSQKAALLLIALGQQWATEILRMLKEDEVTSLSFWISQMKFVPPELTEKVIKEFYARLSNKTSLASSGGDDYLYKVLVGVMGEAKAKKVIEDIARQEEYEVFRILKKIDPTTLGAYLKNERPQTIALMLAYLDPKRSADIISALPDNMRAKVVIALAKMEETDPEIAKNMESALMENLGAIVSDKKTKKLGGNKQVAEILNFMNAQVEKSVMERISDEDFDLAAAIKDLMFVFADIVLLDDKSMQAVLKEVEQGDLILALKGADPVVQEKIFSNVSKRQVESLRDELAFLGPVKGSVVHAAQQKIVNLIRKMDEEGKVLIQGKGGGDEIIS